MSDHHDPERIDSEDDYVHPTIDEAELDLPYNGLLPEEVEVTPEEEATALRRRILETDQRIEELNELVQIGFAPDDARARLDDLLFSKKAALERLGEINPEYVIPFES